MKTGRGRAAVDTAAPSAGLPPTAMRPSGGPQVAVRRPPTAVSHRRWSLRARLIALVVATAAVALVAVNIVLPLVVRDAAIAAKDATLTGVITTISRDSAVSPSMLSDLSSQAQLRGEIGWSSVSGSGISLVEVPTVSDSTANPDVTGIDWSTSGPVTVPDSENPDVRYRARGFTVAINRQPGYLVAWIPLTDIDQTFRRLILVELLVTGGLLVLLGATAGLVIRRELRPLESMATSGGRHRAGRPETPGRRVGPEHRDRPAGRRVQRHAGRHLDAAGRAAPQ